MDVGRSKDPSVILMGAAAPEIDDFSPGLAFNKAASPQPMQRAQRELRALARSLQLDLTPVAEALETFLQAPCESEARALIARLPELLPEDPQSAAILEQALSEAFADEAVKSSHAVDKSGLSAVRGRPLAKGEPSTLANARPEPKRGGNPKNPGQFSKTPGSGQREGETPSKRDAHGTFDEAKLAADPRANKARAKSVITHLLAKKGGSEPKALYRKDTGWIGIDYGTSGNPDNDYKGGHGLAHIIAKHPGAEQMLLDTLLNGEAYKHPFERRKLCLIRDNYVAVLSKMRNGRLLITDFRETRQEKLSELKSQGLYHSKGEN